jgi:hypothetical protein
MGKAFAIPEFAGYNSSQRAVKIYQSAPFNIPEYLNRQTVSEFVNAG